MKNFEKEFDLILEKKLLKASTPEIDLTDEEAFKEEFPEIETSESLKKSLVKKEENIIDDTNVNRQVETITMKEKLLEWVDIMGAFVEFINGNDPHSIQRIIASAPADSLFEKIRISEGKKISRAAVDLSALREALKSYIVSNPDKK